MAGYTKLFSSITDSTVWREPDRTRLVWITMLAMADADGYVAASVPGLADRARVPLEDCLKALEAFRAPDEWSRTKEYEGRRIVDVDGGWQLLNHGKYRAIQDAEQRREQSRLAMQRLRAERKAVSTVNTGEQPFTQAEAEAAAKDNATSNEVARARRPDDPLLAIVAGGKPKPSVPDCPQLEILALWAQVLPSMPQHTPSQWRGARADHLRARWRESAAEKSWPDQAAGITYFSKLFAYVGQSQFLTGRASTRDGKRPFVVELEWLVKPINWAKVIEGKYHTEAA